MIMARLLKRFEGAPPVRHRRVLAGLVMLGVSFAMANAVDDGVTRPWPGWARALWGGTLLAGALGGMLLWMNGMGMADDELLAPAGDPHRREPSPRTLLLVYGGFVAVGAVLALAVEARYGVARAQVVAAYGGATFVLASLGRPWWLYATLRRMGWFRSIRGDTSMRLVLAVLGVALLAAGLGMDWNGPP